MLLDKTIIFNARNWGGCKTEKLSSINCILNKNQSNYITVVVCNCVAVFVHGSDPVRCQALYAYKANVYSCFCRRVGNYSSGYQII